MINIITGILSMGATFTLADFPPTNTAAQQHSLQAYLQVQQWLERDLPTELISPHYPRRLLGPI